MSRLRTAFLNRNYSLTLGAERRIWLTGLLFVLFLSAAEWLYFGNGFPQFFGYLSKDSDPIYLVIGLFYVVAALYLSFLFVLITLASKWLYKPIYLFLFALVTFFEYGYSNALGRFTNFYDLISAFSATREQTLDSVYTYISFSALVPCLVLILLCIFIKKARPQFGPVYSVLLFLSLLLFYLHFSYVNQIFFGYQFVSNSFGSFCQTTADFMLINPVAAITGQKREVVDFSAPAPDFHPDNNIIFVFDESVRGDHLSLNGYGRPTTPYLQSLAKDNLLLNWGIASSASTISHPSYNAMITGATSEMLDKKSFSQINSMPTLFQYAKSMNYRTCLIDGQMKTYWGGNSQDLKYIDDFISMKELDSPNRVEDWELGNKITNQDNQNNTLKQWEIDQKIARIVNRIFSGSTGNFVFIYKRGDHFPYEKNYPESEAVWKPVYHFKEQYEVPPADQYQAIVNSYDNAVRYNLDNFFRQLSPDYSKLPNNTVIIYTGDHGESFFVNGKAGHGGTTREEAMVPLFILGLKDKPVDTSFKASHANVFTTLLDLMGYPREKQKYQYEMSLFDGKGSMPVHRYYNPPPGKKFAFD
jgi:glucan phosphoethanolaminetransferase (alkaline phosphatase superfamily)